jgi:hypothetical protein
MTDPETQNEVSNNKSSLSSDQQSKSSSNLSEPNTNNQVISSMSGFDPNPSPQAVATPDSETSSPQQSSNDPHSLQQVSSPNALIIGPNAIPLEPIFVERHPIPQPTIVVPSENDLRKERRKEAGHG